MEKFTNEELLDVLDSSLRESKELTPKQKAVLGQLFIYDGLNKKDKDGYFYRSNKDLCNDCDIKEEKTLIAAVRKLAWMGFIDTVRGSRKDGASLYRLNKKVIGDYCKTPVKDYSNDYSKQIDEMANIIRELENTVKKLVERITVIEGKNYSTDTDIDKELEIDKEKYNNILNKNNNNNILEKTVSIKELETGESVENSLESQPVIKESQTSSPVNEESPVVPLTDSTGELEEQLPTEEEQYQQCIQFLQPLFCDYPNAASISELDGLKHKTIQAMRKFKHQHCLDEEATMRVAGVVSEKYCTNANRIETQKQEMANIFKKQSSLVS